MENGDTFERQGETFRLVIEPDHDHGPPWEESDRHGPVSDWTTRAKRPGEQVLCADRGHYRYYDFEAAVALAKRDGWGSLPGPLKTEKVTGKAYRAFVPAGPGRAELSALGADINRAVRNLYGAYRAGMTAAEYAVKAVEKDIEYLRRWCNNEWCYVVISVAQKCNCCDNWSSDSNCLGGLESDDYEYIAEKARELAEEIIAEREPPRPRQYPGSAAAPVTIGRV